MKKALSLILILTLSLCFAFAADTSIKLNGTIPEGYTGSNTGSSDTPDGAEEVVTDGGLTIVASVAYDDDVADFTNSDNKPSAVENKTVNLTGDEAAEGIKKLTIHYGAYGNVSGTAIPSVEISVSCPGWKLDGQGDAVETLDFDMTTTGLTKTVFKGEAGTKDTSSGVSNIITFGKNAADGGVVASSSLEAVGYTAVTWGVADGSTPQAGDYSATITITVSGDGGADL